MLESWEDSWLQTRNNKSRVIKKKIAVVAWETSSRESRSIACKTSFQDKTWIPHRRTNYYVVTAKQLVLTIYSQNVNPTEKYWIN